jgi:uncharacterized membrane protein
MLLYELSVWLHILAACAWLGGMAFLVIVLVPMLRRGELATVALHVVEHSGRRFRALGWGCLATLIVTGTINMAFRGVGWLDVFDLAAAPNPMVQVLRWKLLLVFTVLVVSALHDFWLGPRAARRWRAEPSSAQAARERRTAALLGRVNGLLSVAIVLLAVAVVRGWPS